MRVLLKVSLLMTLYWILGARTLVRSDLVGEKSHGLRKTITVQCTHGDSVKCYCED